MTIGTYIKFIDHRELIQTKWKHIMLRPTQTFSGELVFRKKWTLPDVRKLWLIGEFPWHIEPQDSENCRYHFREPWKGKVRREQFLRICRELRSRHETCKKAMLAIRFIGILRKYLSKDHLKMMVNAFVTSRLDYCNSLYRGLPKREIDKLQRVQNSTVPHAWFQE